MICKNINNNYIVVFKVRARRLTYVKKVSNVRGVLTPYKGVTH
jgi:hypothetical protein